jgi:hypothetical protein
MQGTLTYTMQSLFITCVNGSRNVPNSPRASRTVHENICSLTVQNKRTTEFLEPVVCKTNESRHTTSDQLTEFNYATMYVLRVDLLLALLI